jgi:hypothetical protein
MGQQRLHSALAPIDILTRLELEEALTTQVDLAERATLRGLTLVRFPLVSANGNGGTLNLGATSESNDMTPVGPEQGDVWLLRRVIVASSSTIDTARYLLYRGSDANVFDNRHLLDGQTVAVAPNGPAVSNPAVPGSGVVQSNYFNQPVTVTVAGGTVTAINVNGNPTGLTSGTVVVPAGGNISLTYSVAPTWSWGATIFSQAGQYVNINYFCASKSLWLNPGDQIYAQVINSVTGNNYCMSGEALRVPAEMKGKLIA